MKVMADSGGQPKQEQETLHSTEWIKTTEPGGFCLSLRHFLNQIWGSSHPPLTDDCIPAKETTLDERNICVGWRTAPQHLQQPACCWIDCF